MRPAFLIPFAVLSLAGCRKDSPEALIKKTFEACVKAIETGEPGGAIENLSANFSGPDGMGRDEAKLYLMGLLHQQKIGITILSDHIQVNGPQATQQVEMVVTGATGGSLLPDDASHRTFSLRWERIGGAWRLRGLEIINGV